ncbi:hypothetical protein BFF93_01680 [Elizabethkingia meningoseptica]|nr:hypothetical protein BFF93_01680 [Elizabethkingia meningoseptica]
MEKQKKQVTPKTGIDVFWSSGDKLREERSRQVYQDAILSNTEGSGVSKASYKFNTIDKRPINKQEQDLIADLKEEDELQKASAEQEIKSTITFNIEVLKKGKLSLEKEYRDLYIINILLFLSVIILVCIIWRYKLNK